MVQPQCLVHAWRLDMHSGLRYSCSMAIHSAQCLTFQDKNTSSPWSVPRWFRTCIIIHDNAWERFECKHPIIPALQLNTYQKQRNYIICTYNNCHSSYLSWTWCLSSAILSEAPAHWRSTAEMHLVQLSYNNQHAHMDSAQVIMIHTCTSGLQNASMKYGVVYALLPFQLGRRSSLENYRCLYLCRSWPSGCRG